MPETPKSLLAKAKKSLTAAQGALGPGESNRACHQATLAAALSGRAIALLAAWTGKARSLVELMTGLGRDELISAASALDASALTGRPNDCAGHLEVSIAQAVLEIRGGMYSQEDAAVAAFCAKVIVTRAEEVCALMAAKRG